MNGETELRTIREKIKHEEAWRVEMIRRAAEAAKEGDFDGAGRRRHKARDAWRKIRALRARAKELEG